MASSTTNLDIISSSQSAKEITANALADASSPATLFGRRATTTAALTWGYYGGYLYIDGVSTAINNGTVALTANQTNYVESTRAGVVSKNTTGWTPGSVPLYEIVTGESSVTSYIDRRVTGYLPGTNQRAAISITSDANITATQAQAMCRILSITSTVSLVATRNVVLPLGACDWIVYNGTTGGQSLQFIGATGTGITVANGKRAIIYADGTNIVRVTADQ